MKYWLLPLAHGEMAPSASDRSRLGTISSGSTSKRVPRPSQRLAGAVGRVEGEVARGQLLEGAVAVGAGQVLGEGEGVVGLAVVGAADRLAVALHELHLGHAVGQAEGRLERVGEAALEAVAHDEPVDDDLDGVLLVAGQVDLVGELVDLAVDPGPGVALGGEVGEERLVGALAAAHDRGQHLEAGALRAARGCGRRSAGASAA